MNRGQLLNKIINKEYEKGQLFRCKNTGKEIEFNGRGLVYTSGVKEGKMLMVAFTNDPENWSEYEEKQVPLAFTIDKATVNAIKELAKRNRMTENEFMQEAMKKYIEYSRHHEAKKWRF